LERYRRFRFTDIALGAIREICTISTVGVVPIGLATTVTGILRMLLVPVRPIALMASLPIGRLPICWLAPRKLFLIGRIDPEIVLGMLEVVFRGNPVTGTESIPRERQIFLVHLKRVSANSHARSVTVEHLLTVGPAPSTTTAAARAFRALALFHIS
jgi:hypothetical protein